MHTAVFMSDETISSEKNIICVVLAVFLKVRNCFKTRISLLKNINFRNIVHFIFNIIHILQINIIETEDNYPVQTYLVIILKCAHVLVRC